MNELITVVVPVYNIAPLLSQSIGSLLNQTYKNIEIVAVDDGSKDSSLHILKEIAKRDSRLRIIHQENMGVTKARLAGIREAKGVWIGFMDGDDEVEPDMYSHLIHNAIKYNAQISHCGYQRVFPGRVDFYYNTGKLLIQNNSTGLQDLLEGKFVEPGLCNKLFHRTLFYKLIREDVIDTSIKNNEDLLMNYYLFKDASTIVYEDFCPYHYIARKGSASTSVSTNKLRDPLRVFKIIKKETVNDTVLQHTIDRRIIGILISLSTIEVKDKSPVILYYRDSARKELKKMLSGIIRDDFSSRTKILSIWAAFFPWSYMKIHKCYAIVRGTNKKYKID